MVQNIIHKLLLRRHFWRHATFSEIAELYTSRMLRMLAVHMTAAFTSIFLYQSGYNVLFIACFWGSFYLFKSIVSLPAAAVVARVGPKHSILISNFLFIPAMVALALLPHFGIWVLSIVVIFQGVSAMLYQIGYSVDFSKVKSVEHAGKEIAYMNIIEKVTTGLSPLIGGLLAFVFGPEVVIVIAAILFMFAALPLLKTAEPTRPKQKLNFKGLPKNLILPNIGSYMAIGFDVFTSGTVWTMFTAITIIGISSSNEVYATNGILLSVVMLSALAASYAYGKLIDHRRGLELLQLSVIANSLTHLMRPFIGTPITIAGLNVANEAATTGYMMSFTRGNFDNADLSGHRITYVGIVEGLANLGAFAGTMVLVLLVMWVGDIRAMTYFFFVAAVVVLLIATARFPLYRK